METILTQSPARVSFANGGDTDYFLKEIGWGCIVNATLSSLFYQCKIEPSEARALIYNDLYEKEQETTMIENLRLDGGKIDLIKATISHINPYFKGIIEISSNIPKESGLGGSSTLNVALALALLKQKGEVTNPEELAQITYYIERKILQVDGGYQDQWAAAYGRGLNLMIFKDKRVEVVPIHIAPENLRKLEQNSLLVYIGKREGSGADVHKDQEKQVQQNKEQTKAIMIEKRNNTMQMKEALEKGDFEQFAELMNKDWELKQKLSEKIIARDDIYTTAINHGALGGRICGAGSGGTYYFYCKEGARDKVLDAIKEKIIMQLPFKIQRAEEIGGWYRL